MLRQQQHEITIATRARAFHEITDEVSELLCGTKMQTGQVTLHLQHTSASLVIQENADPDVRRDFEKFFARLVPDGDAIFIHTAEGADDMSAHIRTALTAVNRPSRSRAARWRSGRGRGFTSGNIGLIRIVAGWWCISLESEGSAGCARLGRKEHTLP